MGIKILHTADWHLGRKLEGHNRHAEQADVLAEICQIADNSNIDAVVVAGDVFDKYASPSEAEELFYHTITKLAAGGHRLVAIVAGNHDHPSRLENTDPLARALGIVQVARWNTIPKAFETPHGIRSLRRDEGFIEVAFDKHPFPLRLVLSPFVNSARLGAGFGSQAAFADVLRRHWQGLSDKYLDARGANLLATHHMVLGPSGLRPTESRSERSVAVGGTQALNCADFPTQLQYVALGHIHKSQVLQNKPFPVVYSGSPLQYSVSEAGQTKSVEVLELDSGKPAVHFSLPLKAGLPIIKKQFSDPQVACEWLQANPDCYVELHLEVDGFLQTEVQKRIQEAHPKLLAIIPVLTQKGDMEKPESLTEADLVDLSFTEIFKRYYMDSRKSPAPSDLLELYEALARKDPPPKFD